MLPDDIITSLGGMPVYNEATEESILRGWPPRQPLHAQVMRGEMALELVVMVDGGNACSSSSSSNSLTTPA